MTENNGNATEQTQQNVSWDETKREAFRKARIAGWLRDLAIARGGTGHKRKTLTAKERAARKAKRKQAKMSRRRNRG